MADRLRLPPGGRLIDAGSGLGQAAVDLFARHELTEVVGVNPNQRQVAFANALAASQGLADRIRHRIGDACVDLSGLDADAYDGALALECIGHFPNPEAFLRDAARALKPGRRIAFCLNLAKRSLSVAERTGMKLAYGFVPAEVDVWLERLAAAGFTGAEHEDLTDQVLEPMTRICLERIDAGVGADVPATSLKATRMFLRGTRKAVLEGRLGYGLISASA